MKSKQQKRHEAAFRQREYDKLSPQEKLRLLDKRGLIAKRQRNKLMSELAGGKKSA